MTLTDQIKQCKTPRDAILALAFEIEQLNQRLDSMTQDDWDTPFNVTSDAQSDEPKPFGQDTDGVVTLPLPSDAKWDARLQFATGALNLNQYAKDENEWPDVPEEGDTWADVYADSGPYWLYTVARDFCMGLPRSTRMIMVEDIEEDDPETARVVARDLLKFGSEDTVV